MTKKELIDKLSFQNDVVDGTKAGAARIVDFLIDTIKSEVAAGNSVDISGLGKFIPTLQKGKTGTVPGTTKTYTTQDKMVPKFKAASSFKDAVATGK